MKPRIVLTLALIASACKPASTALTFPKNFLFGVATAGFQNEMGCPTIAPAVCEDQNSDWYQWITTPSIVGPGFITGGAPTTGPGFFELYPQDLALAKNDLQVGAVRMSLEWSRIFPTDPGSATDYPTLRAKASLDGINFYHSVFAELKKDGLKPLVTINHYTLPLWIHDGVACHDDISTCSPSGWLNSNTITEIARYAGFVAKEYGGEVDLWATLNEPLAVPLSGYLEPSASRSNPPGVELQAADVKTVIMNEIQAHAQMYAAVKANDTVDADGDGVAAEVGLVYNMAPAVPYDPTNELDQQAATNTFYLYNTVFLNAIIDGKLDVNLTGEADAVSQPSLATSDYLGINYYNQIVAVGTNEPLLPSFSPLLTLDFLSPNTNLAAINTQGIYEMIQFVEQKYNHIPIYITENGVNQGADDPTAPHDMVQYLSWVQKATAQGANVKGYFWWTLTDNYEWNSGMTRHFGLYSVDPTTKARAIRPLGQTYQQIVQAREIPSALAKADPIQ